MGIRKDPVAMLALAIVLGALVISFIAFFKPHLLNAIGLPF